MRLQLKTISYCNYGIDNNQGLYPHVPNALKSMSREKERGVGGRSFLLTFKKNKKIASEVRHRKDSRNLLVVFKIERYDPEVCHGEERFVD